MAHSKSLSDYQLAVTPIYDCGRFGDRLCNYMKALYVSVKYKVPLLYHPFPYSHQFVLSEFHPLYSAFSPHLSTTDNHLYFLDLLENNRDLNRVLYTVPFCAYFLCKEGHLEDIEFLSEVRRLVRPISELPPFPFPPGCINVAIHIRSKNNGYDSEADKESFISKFIADDYYLSGLKQIADFFPNERLYVHIFTDDPNPCNLRDLYAYMVKRIGVSNEIIWGCRESGNSHDRNVFEDFISLTQFDCVIRGESNFSFCAAVIAGPIIEVTPFLYKEKEEDDHFIIDNYITYRDRGKGSVVKRVRSPVTEVDYSSYEIKQAPSPVTEAIYSSLKIKRLKQCTGHTTPHVILKAYNKKKAKPIIRALSDRYKNDPAIKDFVIHVEKKDGYYRLVVQLHYNDNENACDCPTIEYFDPNVR